MAEIDFVDEKQAEEVREAIVYNAAVIVNIRARLDKYHECYVDDKDLVKMWARKSWLNATGNYKERVRKLAKEMDADVDWPDPFKSEARFYRKVPLIEVVGPSITLQ